MRIALAILALTVILAELGARWFLPEPMQSPVGPRHLVERDPWLGIRLRPGFRGRHVHPEFAVDVYVDALGFRDDEVALPKPPGTVRVLALGDSFTYGYGVRAEESFPERLEHLWNARDDGRRVDVINLGVPSFSTVQMGLLLDRWIDRLEADLVLFTFLVADDLRTNAEPPLTERGGLPFHPAVAAAIDASWRHRFAVDHCQLLLHQVAWEMRRDHGIDLSDPLSGLRRTAGSPPAPPALEAYERPVPEAIAAQWAVTDDVLSRVFARAREARVPVVLVNLPLPHLVDDDLWRRAVMHYELDEDLYDFRTVAEHLEPLAREHGGHFVDLVRGFRERGASAADFFPLNLHFTTSGHRLTAELLHTALAEFGLP